MGNDASTQAPKEKESDSSKEIDEQHLEFELAYDMMLGIRHTVSKQANQVQAHKILASQGNVIIGNEDHLFSKEDKYNFPKAGSAETPPHKMRDFKFKDYSPEIFNQLREWFGIDAKEYLLSLCGNFNLLEFISNSKSGEFFFYSHDRKFLIKTMAKSESLLLRKLLPEYFNYISRQPNTLLTKFFGMHRVKTPNRSNPVYFIIMGSVFNSKRDIHRIYDLKGSMFKRKAKVPKGPEAKNKLTTQKDIDWLQNTERIRVDAKTAKLFTHQLRRDIEFLKKSKIMDYSLLVGIHNLNQDQGQDINVSNPETNLNHATLKPQTYGINTRIRKQYKYLAKRPTEVGFNVPDIDVQLDEKEQTLHAIRSNPFITEDGGMRSESGDCIYFTGIIDILQLYNKRKKLEHMLAKGRPKIDSSTISCIPPDDYGTRMYKFLTPAIGPAH